MKRGFWLYMLVMGLGAAAVVSCRRSEPRSVRIAVPGMTDQTAVRIVTNAALDEVVGRYETTQHDYEVDLSNGLLLYHESAQLLSGSYLRRIETRLREVGFEARVAGARLNPPSLVPTADGPIQMWADRYTSVIVVPGMKTVTDANIVVDAIAYARLGRDDPRVIVHPQTRSLLVTFEGLRLSPRNIENAIAAVGYRANSVPARLGAQDALPQGWTPVRLDGVLKRPGAGGAG